MPPILLHRDVTDRILAEYYKVFNELRFGFKEDIYQRAMVIALTEAGLSVQEDVPMCVWFRGRPLGTFRADIVVEGVLLEIKATRELERRSEAQAIHYLSATDLEVALILNFGEKPEFKRLILTNDRKVRVRPAAGTNLEPTSEDPCRSVAKKEIRVDPWRKDPC